MSASAGGRPDARRARVLERLAAGPSPIAAAARRADVVGLLEVIADHDDEHHDMLAARVR